MDPWYRGLARFAGTGPASLLAFSWALSEAVWFFLVPEFVLCFLVVPRPRRALTLAGWATAGSVVGGLGAFFLSATTGSHWLLDHSLLVTPRMRAEVGDLLLQQGSAALWAQPLSGIPYKVFASLAGGVPSISPLEFALVSVAARGLRIVAFSVVFALIGHFGAPFLKRHFWWPSALGVLIFFALLARTVQGYR